MIKRFVIGFGAGILIFIAINLLSAHLASDCGLLAVFGRDACADDIVRAGWPVQFYEEGGFAYRSIFSLGNLSLDLAMCILEASILGWLFGRYMK